MKDANLFRTIVLAGLMVALAAGVAGAEEAAVKVVGGKVEALGAYPPVRLVTARIEAAVGPEESRVSCQYVFENEGGATAVTLGCPASAAPFDPAIKAALHPIRGLRSWVDGKAVATGLRGAWYVKTVSFAKGQRRVVREEYVQPTARDAQGYCAFVCPLRPLSSWRGSVGRLDIVLRWVGAYEWGRPEVLRGGGGWAVSAEGRELKRSQRDVRPSEGLRLAFADGWDDVRLDGYRLGGSREGVLIRATRERTEITSRALASALRAKITYNEATRTARLVTSHHSIVLTTGSSRAVVDGQAVRLTGAVRQEGGRQWVAAGVIFEKLGYRAVSDFQHGRLELYSGQPPAWLGTARGPEGKSAELYLTSRGGVLLGEIRGLAAAIPGAVVATPASGKIKISLEKAASKEPHFEGSPAGSQPAREGHELVLTFGSTEARLDGKAYALTAAPFVNPLGHGMAPVASVCKALGLTAAYSEGNKTVTVGG
jgi:hypothetical protein